MSKVIVERPRLGGGASRKGRVLDYDDLPSHEGMASPHRRHWRGKSLNENLSPLRRFLESRVGQYWPKVYAEICENLRPTSTVQQHVRDHLKDFVAVRTSIKDGVIWVHGGWRVHRLDDGSDRLYVHPTSHCLLRNKHWRAWRPPYQKQEARAAAELAERRRDLGANRQLHKLRGCWFEVTLAPTASRREAFTKAHDRQTRLVTGTRRDEVIDAGLSDLGRLELYGRLDVFAVAKRQLSRRELRERGLQND
jgi:hypothetical protein